MARSLVDTLNERGFNAEPWGGKIRFEFGTVDEAATFADDLVRGGYAFTHYADHSVSFFEVDADVAESWFTDL